MYKIHRKGRMSADLFFDDLQLAKQAAEKYVFEEYLPELQRCYKDGDFDVLATEWKQVKNKHRFYLQYRCLKHLHCIETILQIS